MSAGTRSCCRQDLEGQMPRITVENALSELRSRDVPFKELFTHGSLVVEMYKPEKVDLQQPHTRDEVYVIARGSREFINGDDRHAVVIGEVLFVPAGVEHRFVDFSDDFATWVIFYGPEGGESA